MQMLAKRNSYIAGLASERPAARERGEAGAAWLGALCAFFIFYFSFPRSHACDKAGGVCPLLVNGGECTRRGCLYPVALLKV